MAATHFSVAAVAGSGASATPQTPVSINVPVNLRPKCNPPVRRATLRPYLSSVDTAADVTLDTTFWALARVYRAQLVALRWSSGDQVGLLRFVAGSWVDLQRRFATRPPHGRRYSASVSNVGLAPGERERNLGSRPLTELLVGMVLAPHRETRGRAKAPRPPKSVRD